MVSHQGYALNSNAIIDTIQKQKYQECVVHCFGLQTCWSFNTRLRGNGYLECQFLSTDRFRNADVYMVSSLDTHYSIEVRKQCWYGNIYHKIKLRWFKFLTSFFEFSARLWVGGDVYQSQQKMYSQLSRWNFPMRLSWRLWQIVLEWVDINLNTFL